MTSCSSIRYYAELQQQLGIIQLTLQVPASSAATPRLATITAGKEEGWAKVSLIVANKGSTRSEGGYSYVIKLPGLSKLQSVIHHPIEPSSTSCTIRIPIATYQLDSSPSFLSQPPLSAQELINFKPTSIRCSSCSSTIVDLPIPGFTWRNLPSEYWNESAVEGWMCHPSGEFTKRIEEVYREGFWPSSASFEKAEGREDIKSEGIGLVGNGYMMIDAGNDSGLCRGTLKGKEGKAIFTENGSQELDKWLPALCNRCSQSLGTFHSSQFPDNLRQTLKFKDSISLRGSQERELKYGIERFLVADLLERVEAHGIRRFSIVDEEDVERMFIWLFSPNVEISWGSAERKGETMRGVKILYRSLSLECRSE